MSDELSDAGLITASTVDAAVALIQIEQNRRWPGFDPTEKNAILEAWQVLGKTMSEALHPIQEGPAATTGSESMPLLDFQRLRHSHGTLLTLVTRLARPEDPLSCADIMAELNAAIAEGQATEQNVVGDHNTQGAIQ